MPSFIQVFLVFFKEIVMFFIFGAVAFFLLPIATSILPGSLSKSVSGFYQSIAMSLIGRGILLQRTNAGPQLKKSTFDPNAGEAGAEMIRIKGQKRHFFDPENLMGRFRGRPFGLAHEKRSVVLDARMPFFARRFTRLRESDEWIRNGHRKAFFAIDHGVRTLIHLADAVPVIQNRTAPNVPDRIDTFTEKANAMFDSPTRMQWVSFAIFFGIGLGAIWAMGEVGHGSGSAVVETVPF